MLYFKVFNNLDLNICYVLTCFLIIYLLNYNVVVNVNGRTSRMGLRVPFVLLPFGYRSNKVVK